MREHRSELATILWKDTSPQHFDYENGYFWLAELHVNGVKLYKESHGHGRQLRATT